MTPYPNTTEKSNNGKPYYQVSLTKNGKRVPKLVHRLAMEAGVLPNNRNCDEVHHINGKPEDNRPSNLLPTFSGEEHDTLDKLRKDKTKKREYMRMVKKIKELNSEELFRIPHPDYPPDVKCVSVLNNCKKNGLDCKIPVATKYIWGEKEYIQPLGHHYWNGREWADNSAFWNSYGG